MQLEPVCFEAFERMMSRPDAPDLPRRAHVYHCDGDPDRRVTRLPGILMAWLQHRHLAVDLHEPLAPAIRADACYAPPTRQQRRANPGLHVLRPTGTG